ncbi:sulfur carrier protein ThiS [Metabacillus arenae]|uniref:Sulfur carrier protein ThiS n=1 Tax=Metabacillus arenae TaxID=2771434 RepID=A0A926S2D0_9BACI|nr:sulfur carrier protein ThiS [Metabacillus arenae]MBD1381889.1 sulfur carrier protein ThiS [Metabacillus arenae]
MNIQLNGQVTELPEKVKTVYDVLINYELEERIVIVELNGHILSKETYEQTKLSENDEIELVHFVGGG